MSMTISVGRTRSGSAARSHMTCICLHDYTHTTMCGGGGGGVGVGGGVALSEKKKSSRVTERGATQMVSMSIPRSLTPSRYDPEVKSAPPAAAAASGESPFDRQTERTQSSKMAARLESTCARFCCSSVDSCGDKNAGRHAGHHAGHDAGHHDDQDEAREQHSVGPARQRVQGSFPAAKRRPCSAQAWRCSPSQTRRADPR